MVLLSLNLMNSIPQIGILKYAHALFQIFGYVLSTVFILNDSKCKHLRKHKFQEFETPQKSVIISSIPWDFGNLNQWCCIIDAQPLDFDSAIHWNCDELPEFIKTKLQVYPKWEEAKEHTTTYNNLQWYKILPASQDIGRWTHQRPVSDRYQSGSQ